LEYGYEYGFDTFIIQERLEMRMTGIRIRMDENEDEGTYIGCGRYQC
jgi:hypothetical protein